MCLFTKEGLDVKCTPLKARTIVFHGGIVRTQLSQDDRQTSFSAQISSFKPQIEGILWTGMLLVTSVGQTNPEIRQDAITCPVHPRLLGFLCANCIAILEIKHLVYIRAYPRRINEHKAYHSFKDS